MNESNLRILVVEDHCFQLRATQLLLETYGFTSITIADSADAALCRMREVATPYDVLLCDQCLPDLRGVQLIEAATELGKIKHAILLSSLTHDELDPILRSAVGQGLPLLGFLTKPLKQFELATLLTSAV
ncbi:response regulator [Pseudomonas sp. LB3P31]